MFWTKSTDTINPEKENMKYDALRWKKNHAKSRVVLNTCTIQKSSWMSWNVADGTCVSMH